MTEVDATKRPLDMPVRFIPYLDKNRLYFLFQGMVEDLLLSLPKDHLKQMKMFLLQAVHHCKDADRVMLLISPELKLEGIKLVKELIKDLGVFVVTRRCVMDRYEKHEDYSTTCVSPEVLSEVTKTMTQKKPVNTSGWLMFDHPCTVREARCLQQDGILPRVTLVLIPPPPVAPPTDNTRTPARTFFQQDFEGLKYAYKATLKEVYVEPQDDFECIAARCFTAIRACTAGAQGPGQGYHVVGAPGVYRVALIGPIGSGRKTQARMLAKHFGLVYLNFDDLYEEALCRDDEVGDKLRKYGSSLQTKADIVQRRILQKDCLDHGWVLNGYPISGQDFDKFDNMPTPPNRVIILDIDHKLCKQRRMNVAVDWCTGKRVPPRVGSKIILHPGMEEQDIDNELEFYFMEAVAELRAAAGLTAVEIQCGTDSIDDIQTKIQAAVIASPAYNIGTGGPLKGREIRID